LRVRDLNGDLCEYLAPLVHGDTWSNVVGRVIGVIDIYYRARAVSVVSVNSVDRHTGLDDGGGRKLRRR
jgi:hypothetical protein